MSLTLSQSFIMGMESGRDRLYALALAKANGAGGAEQVLRETAREVFRAFTQENVLDVEAAIARALSENSPGAVTAGGAAGAVGTAMPADVWARVAAAVQMEAATSANARALNPDSVLLRPDPLLAPRKPAARREDDGFDLASPSRLIMAGGIVLVIGIVITVYILGRPTAASGGRPGDDAAVTRPATGAALTHPGEGL